jgi:hypothetical protein
MLKEMSVKKDLRCILNLPEQIGSQYNGNDELCQGLPPYAPVDAYPVDEYEACPTSWMHGSDVVSSYFVGVKEKHGMWLDFNSCFYHTHDVAIVISIQGINPITGQKLVAEKALKLEQYHKKCPIHKVNFKQDRYCEKCGYKWPGQNYLATTGTPEMMLWLDGFRTPEGEVRQYIFTEDEMRGVAAQLIGKDRVFAIGIAYYLSKDKKPYTLQRPKRRSNSIGQNPIIFADPPSYMGTPSLPPDYYDTGGHYSGGTFWNGNNLGSAGDCLESMDSFAGDMVNISNTSDVEINCSLNVDAPVIKKGSVSTQGQKPSKLGNSILRSAPETVVPVKQLEIGAGALIQQRVYDDPKVMSYWEEKPAGMIYINYCDEETKKKILDAGRRADKKDGFMKDIKVGG